MTLKNYIANTAIVLGIAGAAYFGGSSALNHLELEKAKARLETAQAIKETPAAFTACCSEYQQMMRVELDESLLLLGLSMFTGIGGLAGKLDYSVGDEPAPAYPVQNF